MRALIYITFVRVNEHWIGYTKLDRFVSNSFFTSQLGLDIELFDYVNWFNNIRVHGSLNYQSPAEYKLIILLKNIQFSVDIPHSKGISYHYNERIADNSDCPPLTYNPLINSPKTLQSILLKLESLILY